MSAPVLLILGAGPKVGVSVAKTFAAKGYKIALTSRTTPTTNLPDSQIHIKLDLAKPEDVPGVFAQVKEKFGSAPSVVVYNGRLTILLIKP